MLRFIDNPRTDLRVLIPEVMDLYLSGALHLCDAEYVARLKPGSQLAAALKWINGTPMKMFLSDRQTSERSTISHGHPGTRNAS